MAIRGFSTSNFLRHGAAVVTAVPLTLSCWAWTPSFAGGGNAQEILGIYNSASAALRNYWGLKLGTSMDVIAASGSGSAEVTATSTLTVRAGTWFHACAVFASATSRQAWLNGKAKGTNTTSNTPTGVNRTSIGLHDNTSASRPFGGSTLSGVLFEPAIWNVALKDAEVRALAAGVPPWRVAPSNLVASWPDNLGGAVLWDSEGGFDMVVQGQLLTVPNPVHLRRTRTAAADNRLYEIGDFIVGGHPVWKRRSGVPGLRQGGGAW